MTPSPALPRAAQLAARLRIQCESLRRKPTPLADLIPLLQECADALGSEQPDSVHQTARADCALTVSEAGVAPETLLRQALDVLNETVPDWRTPMEKQRRMAACLTAIDGFLAAPRPDAADVEREAMRYRWLREVALTYDARAQAVKVYEFIAPIAYGPSLDAAIDAVIEREAATRRDAADTEPHGTDELNSAPAPGESADPQSQGDTQ